MGNTWETLLTPFSPRFIVLTICCVVTVLLTGIAIVDHKVIKIVIVPIIIFGGLSLLGFRDLLQEAGDRLMRALRTLPPKQQAAVVLTELLDYSSDEAGSFLSVKPATARVLAHQGRAALRTLLEEHDE